MIKQNEGARRANDQMHQQKVQNQNQRVENKLDEIEEQEQSLKAFVEELLPYDPEIDTVVRKRFLDMFENF